MQPKISVIVPIYKAEKYLHRCIDSILAQTFTDFELLLIDDGSPDGSGAICDEYAARDNRVRVFHKENGGVSSARNKGLEEARGEWVYFSDADDIIITTAIETLFSNIESNTKYVIGGYKSYNESGCEVYSIKNNINKHISCNDAIKEMFQPTDYRYQGYLWNKLFNNNIIRNNKLKFREDIYFNEDRLFNIEYLVNLTNATCYYTTTPVYKYFERDNSAMASLKRAYNPKYITDFTAFLYMLKALKRTRFNECLEQCKDCTYLSYRQNINFMRKFGCYDKNTADNLRQQLYDYLTFYEVLKREAKYTTKRIINKIKRVFR